MSKIRIFISSTIEDLQEERKILVGAISKNKSWEPIFAESFVARKESPREVCTDEVRQSHIYIGIFKHRYGYIPNNNNPLGLSVVVLEYNEAKENNIPTLIFVFKNDSKREALLKNFIKDISDFDKGHWRKEYSSTRELVAFTIEAINHVVTEGYIELLEAKRARETRELYELPYFRKLQGD